jgi:peptidoglycan/LPS O-acetylase OafA/YrhL
MFYGYSSFAMLGSVGVALFFVHTCLVLMQSLERQDQTRSLFIPFLVRRLFRIYPLSIFMLAMILIFHIPQHVMVSGHFEGWHYRFTDVVSNLLLTQCLWNLSGSIINPMWSLSYEMQMYLLLPIIYLLVRNATLARTLVIWAIALVLNIAVCLAVPHTTLFTYTPCFMSGVVAYKMQQKKVGNFLSAWLWVATLALLTILFIALLQGAVVSVAGWWIASALIGFTIPLFKQCTWKTATRCANLIARYSYGIYVAHYFSMWAVLERMHASVFVKVPVFVVVLAVVSVALYHGIEKPFIELGRKMSGGNKKENHDSIRRAFRFRVLLPDIFRETDRREMAIPRV